MTNVALIDKERNFRECVANFLAASGRFAVVASYESAEEAVDAVPRLAVKVTLCDTQLPGMSGVDAVKRLRARCPALHCMMLTHSDDTGSILAAFAAGASGYLLKRSQPDEIVGGLDELVAGGTPMSRLVARRLVASIALRPARSGRVGKITRREGEILDLLARGLTYKEIATQLGISTATAKNHLYHIYEKLGVRSGTEAAVMWLGR